jgi:hypothetical protein
MADLVLDLSPSEYKQLKEEATRAAKSPQDLVQEWIAERLNRLNTNSTTQSNPALSSVEQTQPIRRVKIPGAYRPTAEEIEASLASIFTPEELAEIEKVDLSKLPTGLKSVTEILNEDREDRF